MLRSASGMPRTIAFVSALVVIIALQSWGSILSFAQAPVFRSQDGKYEATKVRMGRSVHYQVREIAPNRIVFTTHAQFTDSANDVKAGTFSPDSRKIAAAYHYSHKYVEKGGYTWLAIWDIQTGALVDSKEIPGITTDIYSVFKAEKN